jgi:stage V sporulation protein G
MELLKAMIKVTEVHIQPVAQRGGLVAMAKVVINGGLMLNGIGIHQRLDGAGYRLTYPTRQDRHGNSRTICHPVNKTTSKIVEDAIFKAMADELKAVDHDRYHPSTL